jgi:glyoxylase-like metal-dependent hydrolase (beta-lactamase superfamily II)
VLGAVIVVGALDGDGEAAGPATGPKVIDIEKLKDNLYVRPAHPGNPATFSGGNVAVFVTDGGVVLVDTKLAGWGQALLDKVKTVTSKPITTIINTHTHGDHTGNNGFFGATVDSVTHENTAANMAKMDAFKGDNAKFLPKKTFKDRMSIGSGKDRIDLYYFGAGHTNGDAFVVFPALRVLHAGDMFAWKDAPLYDRNNGGSGVAHPQTIAKVLAGIKGVDTVIPGHMPVTTWKSSRRSTLASDLLAAVRGRDLRRGRCRRRRRRST